MKKKKNRTASPCDVGVFRAMIIALEMPDGTDNDIAMATLKFKNSPDFLAAEIKVPLKDIGLEKERVHLGSILEISVSLVN